ncbi:DUF5007 domain-containing protein [Pedobacter nutrimenti]|uniref:DUF5007 domain-containing protein n=1 Tax=Pedobacter nutrimenti TaxID=1241337 RepID=UPI00292FD308|nr:DUF5007 domain-containing protein [Pedobacter nutrimenti]
MITKKNMHVLYAVCVITFFMVSCKKAPAEKDYLSDKATFASVAIYEPVLGRTVLYKTSFNADGSSYPLNFSLQNIRHFDGSPAPELSQSFPTLEWTGLYSGTEKTLKEIEDKRKLVNKPFLEIRPGSGDFIFYKSNAQVINAYPNDGYLFDVKVTNSGNERVMKNFRLRPVQEIPYEPYEFDKYTRRRLTESRISENGLPYTAAFFNHPVMTNVYITKDTLMNDSLARVYFKRVGEGNSLSFKFFDKDSVGIDPAKFNLTKWTELVHGFNMTKTSSEVRYDVAYPIPLTDLDTKYAKGNKAFVNIGFSRTGFNNTRIDANMLLNFGIYEKGDWVIIFKFLRTPRFQND